jgi:hypothetical protein
MSTPPPSRPTPQAFSAPVSADASAFDQSPPLPPAQGHAIAQYWRDVATALTPVFGERGMQALYRRCVQLTGQDPAPPVDPAGPPLRLQAALALDLCFRRLLERLIGPALAEQLMPPFPASWPPTTPPAQEPETPP